ncbi:MAG: hypothetical protein HXO79_07310, partial [Selenomonas sp.]|nr:hypothetical protein [Selenomonas sp.]
AVLNLDHTGLANASNKLTNLTATGTPPNITSNYGKRTGTGFTPDANAGTNKDVQYAGLSAAMNTSLGGNAGNYEFDTDGYGKGYIERATMSEGDFALSFRKASKEYDGTRDVHNAAQYLDKTASHASRTVGGTPSTITLTDDDYVSVDGSMTIRTPEIRRFITRYGSATRTSISVHGTASFEGMVTDISTSAS